MPPDMDMEPKVFLGRISVRGLQQCEGGTCSAFDSWRGAGHCRFCCGLWLAVRAARSRPGPPGEQAGVPERISRALCAPCAGRGGRPMRAAGQLFLPTDFFHAIGGPWGHICLSAVLVWHVPVLMLRLSLDCTRAPVFGRRLLAIVLAIVVSGCWAHARADGGHRRWIGSPR